MTSTHHHQLPGFFCTSNFQTACIRGVTEISTLNLTSNKTRHDEQFFYVRLFSNRQFFLAFSPP
jgi:hypothetical protein